jgi:hypothetical protein
MPIETCIRNGLSLKSHRVQQVRDEQHQPVAEITWQSITKALAASIATLPPKLTSKGTAAGHPSTGRL